MLFCLFIVSCTAPQVTQGVISINVFADANTINLKVPSGSSVQDVLDQAHITMGELDRAEPPKYTVLTDGATVKVTRVRDEYYLEQKTIPFEHQELLNEALPEGEKRLSQPGVNGVSEITYHKVYEDGIEVSNTVVKTTVLKDAIPEVVMVGNRSSFSTINIAGKIAYISAGNAWVIEGTTSNRQIVISTGDLDARIFSLSPDGNFLLFSRYTTEEKSINTLWIALLNKSPIKLINLPIKDVVHFAQFDPSSTMVAYSTVEWREAAPGWQANNDLYIVNITANGTVGKPKLIIEANSGGMYGWWGTDFSWAPDGYNLLFARPDGIGIVVPDKKSSNLIYKITPYQTGGDWAWIPGTAWSPDGKFIYFVDHAPGEASNPTNSQQFILSSIRASGDAITHIADNVGMFSYPQPSPVETMANFLKYSQGESISQEAFSVAYLEAIFPEKSETSGYRLVLIDRDGSNKQILFPVEGAVGLQPQIVVWSPETSNNNSGATIAFIYNGNIWLVDSITGTAQQVTGDGLTTKIDWR